MPKDIFDPVQTTLEERKAIVDGIDMLRRPDTYRPSERLAAADDLADMIDRYYVSVTPAQAIKSLKNRINHLEHGLAIIINESRQFPADDGIGAGIMAVSLLRVAPSAAL